MTPRSTRTSPVVVQSVVVQSVLAGDPGVDPDGCCLGCGRLAEHVAEGAASGCEVCLAFLDWMGCDEEADDA